MAADWTYGRLGYVLAGEEHPPRELVHWGVKAEAAGFGFCFLSDHFHPWNFHQGHSSYLWSVLGALASQTERMALVSAVVCPILRMHPTTLAQAASTVYHLSEGRFHLGLGTGESLNESILGEGFPPFEERLNRLAEAVGAVRELLEGECVTWTGEYFRVEKAQLFDPAPELKIFLAASGERAARFATRKGDGLICLGARPELAQIFDCEKPRLTQLSVCWGVSREKAATMAHHFFPEVAMPGTLFTRLSTPADFSRAAASVSVEDVAASIVCGPDPGSYLEAITDCLEAGFDGVALHQIGPDQEGFLDFWERELKGAFEG